MVTVLARYRNAIHALSRQSCHDTACGPVIRGHDRVDLVVLRGQDLFHIALGIGGQPSIGIGLANDLDITTVDCGLQDLLLTTTQEVGIRIGPRSFDHHVVALGHRTEHGPGLHPANLDIVEGQVEGAAVLDQTVIADHGNALVRRRLNSRADRLCILRQHDQRIGTLSNQALDIRELLGRRRLRISREIGGAGSFQRSLDRRLVRLPALFLEIRPTDADDCLGHG